VEKALWESTDLIEFGPLDNACVQDGRMNDRRKLTDRRSFNTTQEKLHANNRRRFPDRRLNNISVEWVPLNHVHNHPATGTLLAGVLGRILKK
jgi:hypothetical protein